MRFVRDLPATPRYWQVCFMGLEKRFWWDRFLPVGFRHVFLLGYVPEHRIWICYDVLFFKTEIIDPVMRARRFPSVSRGGTGRCPDMAGAGGSAIGMVAEARDVVRAGGSACAWHSVRCDDPQGIAPISIAARCESVR
jgi:hypothetical protein